MKSILVVEDDINIQSIVAYNLANKGYRVLTAEDGITASDILKENEVSLVLMDVMLPELNGFECSQEIRKFSEVPIIMLTSLEEESNVLKGFDCGVDDYMTKPFSMRELIARIESNLRRFGKTQCKSINTIIRLGTTEVNTETFKVKVDNRESDLTETESAILLYFYKNPNKIISRETLLKEVWGSVFCDIHTVDVNIRRLREKIEIDPSNPKIIVTRRGYGYWYEEAKS